MVNGKPSVQRYYLCAYLMQTFPVCSAVEVGDCGSSDCNQGMVINTIFLFYFFTLSFVSSVQQPTHSIGEQENATKESIIILKDAGLQACHLNQSLVFRTEESRQKNVAVAIPDSPTPQPPPTEDVEVIRRFRLAAEEHWDWITANQKEIEEEVC